MYTLDFDTPAGSVHRSAQSTAATCNTPNLQPCLPTGRLQRLTPIYFPRNFFNIIFSPSKTP